MKKFLAGLLATAMVFEMGIVPVAMALEHEDTNLVEVIQETIKGEDDVGDESTSVPLTALDPNLVIVVEEENDSIPLTPLDSSLIINNKYNDSDEFLYDIPEHLNIFATDFDNEPMVIDDDGEWYTVDGIEGGQIKFDKTTGTITDADQTITVANIPREIDGVTVEKIGNFAFYITSYLTTISFPDTLTSIGNNGVYNCVRLTSVTIPESVTSIGSNAFGYCTRLKSITLPNSLTSISSYAFYFCSALTTVIIPSSINSIGMMAFGNSHNISDVYYSGTLSDWNNIWIHSSNSPLTDNPTFHYSSTGPDDDMLPGEDDSEFDYEYEILADGTIKIIGYTGSDENVVIPSTIDDKTVTIIGESAFLENRTLETIVIPSTVTTIEEKAFASCINLITVDIPNSVTSIGDSVFQMCTSLTFITLSSNLTSLGFYAFRYCNSLESITIPSNLTTINMSTFESCRNLITITIPSSVSYVGMNAFNDCDSLTKVYYSGSEEDWDKIFIDTTNTPLLNATIYFDGKIVNDSSFIYEELEDGTIIITGFTGTETIVSIPYSIDGKIVTEIGYSAFYSNTHIVAVVIPDGVKTISVSAFAYCSSLQLVYMSKNISTIRATAFENCTSLSEIWYCQSEDQWNEVNISETAIDPSVTIIWDFITEERNDFVYMTSDDAIEFCNFILGFNFVSDSGIMNSQTYKLITGEYRNAPSYERAIASTVILSILSAINTNIDKTHQVLNVFETYAYNYLEELSVSDGILDVSARLNDILDILWETTELVLDTSIDSGLRNLYEATKDFGDCLEILQEGTTGILALLANSRLNNLRYFTTYMKLLDMNYDNKTFEIMNYQLVTAFSPTDSKVDEIVKWATYIYNLEQSLASTQNSEVTFNCPVEVEVFFNDTSFLMENTQSGTLFTPKISLYVIENEDGHFSKTIKYNSEDDVEFIVTGLEEGTMDYSYTEYNADGTSTTYAINEIPITEQSYITTDSKTTTILSVHNNGDNSEDESLTATEEFRISLDEQDDNYIKNILVTTNGKLSNLPSLSKDDHIFEGWYDSVTDGSEITTETEFMSNTTIYAQWTLSSDNNSGGNTEDNYGGNTEETPDGNTEDNSGGNTEDNSGGNTEDNSGNDTEDNSGGNSEDNSGGNTEDNSGGNTEDNSGGDTEDNSGGNTEDDFGGNTEDNSAGNTDDNSGGNTEDNSNSTGSTGTTGSTGSSSSSSTPTTYSNTIPTFDNGKVTASPSNPEYGDTVTLTITPDSGYKVGTVTVKRVNNGENIEVTANSDGTYSFTQPYGRVSIDVAFISTTASTTTTPEVETEVEIEEEVTNMVNFSDISSSDWFYEQVQFVAEKGLMAGTGDGNFSPYADTTRGMIVTVLHSLAGYPESTTTGGFDDVSSSDWFGNAVAWAKEVGITSGMTENAFDPNGFMTREQLVVMLYAYEKQFGNGGFTVLWAFPLDFTDNETISEWATEATAWCVMNNIVGGRVTGDFDPQAIANRAEVAVILKNFVNIHY